MAASLTFFPVDNGDMTLITLDNGQNILIDIKIRGAADDSNDDTPDVAADLKERLPRDENGRLYVDAFLLSHPDQDHITGLETHFHLGSPDNFPEDDEVDRILIREMWSSPIVFRRTSAKHVLCQDAKAWAKEARRRVQLFREKGFSVSDGDRIVILGKDKDGKTDDIMDIVIEQDEVIERVNRGASGHFKGRLLAPMFVEEDDDLVDLLEKNNSSVIFQFSINGDGYSDKCRFLSGGDAGVDIWERLWERHKGKNEDWFTYHVLQSPHHCSWRSLSHDRWSDMGEAVKVSDDARNALGQPLDGGVVIASSKPIQKDDANPPHERAKREYVSIVDGDDERFFCVTEHWNAKKAPLEFKIYHAGVAQKLKLGAAATAAAAGVSSVSTSARAHGA